jgi:hypothetical protein
MAGEVLGSKRESTTIVMLNSDLYCIITTLSKTKLAFMAFHSLYLTPKAQGVPWKRSQEEAKRQILGRSYKTVPSRHARADTLMNLPTYPAVVTYTRQAQERVGRYFIKKEERAHELHCTLRDY